MDGIIPDIANFSNSSAALERTDIAYILKSRKNFFVIGYSLNAVLCILLNIINIITVPRVKNCFGENTKICLMFLSVVDLFTGLLCSTAGVLFVYLPISKSVGDTIVILCTTFVWQSMWILTLASVDRYIAVTRPLQYYSLASRKRMVCALIAVMILALLNSGGSYLQSELTGVCHPYGTTCPSIIKPSFIIYNFIPFTAVVVTTLVNVRLVLIARRHGRQIAALEAAVNAGNIALPPPCGAGMKGLKTVLVITTVFYLAWLPSTIINFLSPIPGIQIPQFSSISWGMLSLQIAGGMLSSIGSWINHTATSLSTCYASK